MRLLLPGYQVWLARECGPYSRARQQTALIGAVQLLCCPQAIHRRQQADTDVLSGSRAPAAAVKAAAVTRASARRQLAAALIVLGMAPERCKGWRVADRAGCGAAVALATQLRKAATTRQRPVA